MTPIAGVGHDGSEIAELVVSSGLITVALAMIVSVVIIIIGLIKYGKEES
ncbi:MAG: hypothetical protein V2I33_15555 [Kangiellaceae bacterium]|jgi:hypothetical protein|nr:hypothetical protein [Kangiellaceae bacterium]